MPRSAPSTVVEQRITLGTYERQQAEHLLTAVRRATIAQASARAASSLGLITVGGAVALGLVGLGLGDDLDRERIRDVILGTPSVRRTKADGTEQVIENPLFGVPILGPLFGTGMRIGEKTAEVVTETVAAVSGTVEGAMRAAADPESYARPPSSAGGWTPPGSPSAGDARNADPARRWSSASAGGWSP